ncbi:MAG: hypothetical protein NZR01_04700 [Bryobacteraceae bacterium]|nr:hypothetical protein [Bryobacteraceae bacterium]
MIRLAKILSHGAAVGVAVLLVAGFRLEGAAWVQKRGHGIVLVGVNGYRAEERFSPRGGTEPLGPDGVFRSVTPQVWAEVGLTDRWTGILNFGVPSQRYEQTGYRASSTALGDLQAGLRRALRAPDQGWQVSAQLLVKAPGYSSRVEPRPGNGQLDVEGSLLAGRSFPVGSRWAYFTAEGGYRARWGRPADQWRGELAAGVHATPRITLMGQSFFIRSVGAEPASLRGPNPLIEPYFHLARTLGSVVFRAGRDWRIQAGYGFDVAGTNTGKGRQWVLAIWKTF